MKTRILKSSLFILPIGLLIVFFTLLSISLQINASEEDLYSQSITDGLQEIKVSFQIERNGSPEILSLSNLSSAIILAAAERAEESEDLLPVTLQQVLSELSIREIVLPPLPENSIIIVDKYDSNDVAIYLEKIYTIFSENRVDLDFAVGFEETQKGNPILIEEQLEKNKTLYQKLLEIEVPSEAYSLHRMYIRITQVQHHFLNSILRSIEDPVRIMIDMYLVQTILEEVDDPLRNEIKRLAHEYDIQLQQEI